MKSACAALVSTLLATCPAMAEIKSLDDNGFVSAHSAGVSASPDKAYAALTDISSWWNGDHSFSGDAANLYLDASAKGCFCEKLPAGGWVEHLRIIFLAPGTEIRLRGGLGPLQDMGLAGTMTWKITPEETGSRLDWQYTVHGHLDQGFEEIAVAVDGVIGEQFTRLAALLESG